MIKNKEVVLTMEQGLDAIMDIIGDAGVKVEDIKTEAPETIYDGRGHAISVNGKKTTVGYKKNVKRVKNSKDVLRGELLDAVEVLLSRVKAFEGKVGRNSVDGVIVRMADADYTVKVTGHAKPEFADRDTEFRAEKSYATRGKAINHTSAIAKILVDAIENENPVLKNENQKSITLLEAKAAGVRFEIDGAEFSFKMTKKRARVVMA